MKTFSRQSILIFIVLVIFISCEKENNTPGNYFLINNEKIEIETAQLILQDGETVTGLKDFRLRFYTKGVYFYKNKAGYDSIVYDDNSIRIYFWLYKPKDKVGYSGEYVYYIGNYPYTNDFPYSFDEAGYLNSGINGHGISDIADSGKVIIKEIFGILTIDFEFFRSGVVHKPGSYDIKGKFIGKIQMIYE